MLTIRRRPRTDAGPDAPMFPIVVKCASETDARKVIELQKLLEGINQKTATRNQVARLFVRTLGDNCVDIHAQHFYAVWVGSGVGVYHKW